MNKIDGVIITLVISFVVLCIYRNRSTNPIIKKCISYVLGLICFLIIAWVLNIARLFDQKAVINYMSTITKMLEFSTLVAIILLIMFVLNSIIEKQYQLRPDTFKFGGITVTVDKSREVFIRTVGPLIESKRTLFYFDEKRDNIFEVLNSYYEVLKILRDNLTLLDNKKDQKLYTMSINILKKLNWFLTKHQNDYRRWYDKISSDNEIDLGKGKKIIVHQTTIEDVQKNYYRYEELLVDIAKLNKFMSESNIKEKLSIDDLFNEIDV